MINESDIKQGMTIWHFQFFRWAGSIWSLELNPVVIEKVNEQTYRINFKDHNGGQGNAYRIEKSEVLNGENYALTKEELFKRFEKTVHNYAERADFTLKGYTPEHPDYDYWVYTKAVLNDFSALMKKGYNKADYDAIMNKYKEMDAKLTKKLFS